MKTFLLQGDSITDFGRSREDENGGGSSGYATMVNGYLSAMYPGELKFVNRSISGNRSVDLYARIKRDFINVKPDYLSILIGVNDVWHDLNDDPNGVCDEKYFKVYSMLIEEIQQELPDCKIMILEPFILSASGTQEQYEFFRSEVEKRAVSAKRVAEKYHCTFIPLQKTFDECCQKAEPSYWLGDGVHPTPAGHAVITKALCDAFIKIK